MSELPLVSFCLFTYNQERYIEEAIDGAFSQDYDNLEIIISDDSSTDSTWEIINKKTKGYSGKHKVILNRNENNLGLAAHVNKLYYELSQGKYVAIAAGDDISMPQRISKSVDFLEKNSKVVALSTSMKVIDHNSETVSDNRWLRKTCIFTPKHYTNEKFDHISGASRIISRKLLKVFPKLNLDCPTEDATFLFRAFLVGSVAEIDHVGVYYRVHNHNVSKNINKKLTTINKIAEQHKTDLNYFRDNFHLSIHVVSDFQKKIEQDSQKRRSKDTNKKTKTTYTKYYAKAKKKLKKQIENPLVKVYSHPRSGTHFLEAFLAQNFYKTKDLSINKITWGHWSNRKVKKDGNPYGKLFGHHFFPTLNNFKKPGIYIIRDGRAVAYSVWKTQNFLHKDINGKISFSDFLRTPLDWSGSPSKKTDDGITIFEHWAKHCDEWLKFSKANKRLLIIYYEDLVNNPYEVYLKIKRFNFKLKVKQSSDKLNYITKPTGLLPNKAKIDSWEGKFTHSDLVLFNSIMNDYPDINRLYR